jgi:hypothetical protein
MDARRAGGVSPQASGEGASGYPISRTVRVTAGVLALLSAASLLLLVVADGRRDAGMKLLMLAGTLLLAWAALTGKSPAWLEKHRRWRGPRLG